MTKNEEWLQKGDNNLLPLEVKEPEFWADFIKGLKPYFDIIVYSQIEQHVLTQIIDHIETLINKPILDLIIKYA